MDHAFPSQYFNPAQAVFCLGDKLDIIFVCAIIFFVAAGFSGMHPLRSSLFLIIAIPAAPS
jgi:hypothetical protein